MNKAFVPTLLVLLCSFSQIVKAQSHYPGQHEGELTVHDKLKPKVYAFDLDEVKLLDSRFKENMQRDINWLMSINVNSLLHSFRTNAGVYSGIEGGYNSTKKIAGWESLDCELRGHTTGHILSALALLYGNTKENKYKIKGDSIVTGLAEVQKALNQNGYLSAFPQELINRNLEGKPVWAPWYTLHKILAGLIDQYLYCDNKQALEVAKGMSRWAYEKLENVQPKQRKVMLRNEFGGINESFYNLYAITGNEHDKWLAHFFYQNEVLDPLKEGKDILDKKHANTYIPKLIGLTRGYEIEGKGDGDSIAAFFWKIVIAHQTFATGSNSDKEHFFKPDAISAHLTGYTGESCNVYNMLKLTRHLYTHTLDMKYADYYELALYNHILGQQDPKTGMVAYFLPLEAGAHRVYSTRDSSFWCCVGTGFENHVKYAEAIYYHTDNGVFINLFIPSELNWTKEQFGLRLESAFPANGKVLLTVTSPGNKACEINIRYPSWAIYGAEVKINGKLMHLTNQPGSYIKLTRKWHQNDKIEVVYQMRLHTVPANDNPQIAALAYGPIILAGEMGTKGFVSREPYSDPRKHNDYYTYDYHIPAGISTKLSFDPKKIDAAIKPTEEPLTFKAVDQSITLRPLYDIHRQRYVVYWNTGK